MMTKKDFLVGISMLKLRVFDLFSNIKERRFENRTKSEQISNEMRELMDDHTTDIVAWKWIFVFLLTSCNDYLLLSQGISAFCTEYHLSEQLKWLFPVVLLLLEIIVSATCIAKERSGEWGHRFARAVKYFVIGIIIAFSGYAIHSSYINYRPDIDGAFTPYFSKTILVQGILLASSILLHLWIIKCSEQIYDSIHALIVKYRQKIKDNRAKETRKKDDKILTRFAEVVGKLNSLISSFFKQYPDEVHDFTTDMSEELKSAINRIMGRDVVTSWKNDGHNATNHKLHG